MFNSGTHRHSVWIDVFGILFIVTVLPAGVGYLLYNGGTMGTGGTETAGTTAEAHRSQGGMSAGRRKAPVRLPFEPDRERLFSSESRSFSSDRSAPGESGVPFSESWRQQASPTTADPSFGGETLRKGSTPKTSNTGTAPSEPSVASSRLPGGSEQGGSRLGQAGSDGRSWQGKAEKLAHRGLALSNELTKRNRSSSKEEPGAENATRQGGSTAKASKSSNPGGGTPGEGSRVPVDDHLHWLLVAGILWGAWRIWRGG